MKIEEIKGQQEWNKNLAKHQNKNAVFLQSWQWGEFQKQAGRGVLRLQNEDGDQIQVFEHNFGFGFKYCYVPRVDLKDDFLKNIADFLKRKNFIFIRLEPERVDFKELKENYNTISVNNRQPENTLLLDLSKLEEGLLEEMHYKTRYNIRLAERKGVIIKNEKNLDIFWRLNQETTKRDKFKSHDRGYYAKMLKLDICCQLNAYFKDQPIASNIFIKYQDTFTYLHGASSKNYRSVMAPYLLQWKAIELAKKLGCKFYDFWGVSSMLNTQYRESDEIAYLNNKCWDKQDPWSGITRFKVGFGGEVKKYPQAFDIVLKPFVYKIYKLAHNFFYGNF